MVIGQSGFLLWWLDENGVRRSALMEAREIVYLFETLGYTKSEATAGFDVVSSFSTMMTSLMDSRAHLKMDSISMSDLEYNSSWLYLFVNSDVRATNRGFDLCEV